MVGSSSSDDTSSLRIESTNRWVFDLLYIHDSTHRISERLRAVQETALHCPPGSRPQPVRPNWRRGSPWDGQQQGPKVNGVAHVLMIWPNFQNIHCIPCIYIVFFFHYLKKKYCTSTRLPCAPNFNIANNKTHIVISTNGRGNLTLRWNLRTCMHRRRMPCSSLPSNHRNHAC